VTGPLTLSTFFHAQAFGMSTPAIFYSALHGTAMCPAMMDSARTALQFAKHHNKIIAEQREQCLGDRHGRRRRGRQRQVLTALGRREPQAASRSLCGDAGEVIRLGPWPR
jgi:hypothetical protein